MLDVDEPDVAVEPSTPTDDRRRMNRACLIGGAAAAVAFLAALAMNGVSFFGSSWTTKFYPAQAQSLMHLRWDIPRSVLGFEGFAHNGKWYMYYGPWPAILRAPIVAISQPLAERLTPLSMLTAFVVALWSTARLNFKMRTLLRGDEPVTRFECWAAGSFVFVVGAGSVLLFLAGQAWIYHEAEIWGAALAIAAFDALVGYLIAPRGRTLALASLLATLALLSRASVGAGPVFALGLLALVSFFRVGRRAFGVPESVSTIRRSAVFATAAAVPLVLYAYTNYAKFGTLFVFPTGDQLMSQVNPQRQAFLAESGGSYFNLKFSATTLLQYLRPDALRISSLTPWIDFPSRASVIGGVHFDAIEPTSSLPSSMPALFLLSLGGMIALCMRRAAALARVRAPLIGAIVAACGAIPFGYIAQRYLSDFIPVLVLAGLAGLQVLLRWTARTTFRRPKVRAVWITLAVLAAASVYVNGALAVTYHWSNPWLSEGQIAPFIEAQRAAPQLPFGDKPSVEQGATLPDTPGRRGTLFVLGDCEAVYWSQGRVPSLAWSEWNGVQRSRAAGEYRLRVKFDHVNKRVRLPLVIRGEPGKLQTVSAFVTPGNRVRFGFHSEGHEDLPRGDPLPDGYFVSRLMKFTPGKEYELVVVMDPNNGSVSVTRDGIGKFLLIRPELTPAQNQALVFPTDTVAIGHNDVGAPTAKAFAGTIREEPGSRPSLCDEVKAK